MIWVPGIPAACPGGHGLRQFAAEIEHIGGSLSTDCENGIWMFHARIPFD